MQFYEERLRTSVLLDGIDHSVAIVIAAYNAEKTIATAVKTALNEPALTELIVVDDASEDATISVALSADDGTSRLRVIRQPHNLGPGSARNQGIKETSATWIGILDADDYFLPGRLAGLLRYSGDADFIADDLLKMNEADDGGTAIPFRGEAITEPFSLSFAHFVEANIKTRGKTRNELGFLKPLMRRRFLIEKELCYCESMRLGEDYDLYARALALGARFLVTPAQGYISVVRENSISGQHTEADLLAFRDSDSRLMNMTELTTPDRRLVHRHYIDTDCRLQWRLLITAVKDRQYAMLPRPFLRSPTVAFHLASNLLEQVVIRGKAATTRAVATLMS